MADKKISQFDTFPGAADDEVFFVVASGDADNPNASNYRYPFNNLTTDITKQGSAWTAGTDSIYTLTGAVGLGTSAPIYQLDVATTGRFRDDLIVSGDLYVSGTTHINKIIDVSITGTISGVTGEFADGIFADSLTISGVSVSTGGSMEVPGGGGSVIGGDVSNINFGGTEASDARAVNFQVGGVDKLVIGSDGNVRIAEDLTVSGMLYVHNSDGGDATDKASMLSEAVMKLQPHATNSTNMLFAQVSDGSAVGMQVTNYDATANYDIALNPFGGNVGIGTDDPQAKLHVTGGKILAPSGDFTESLTISGNSVLTGAAGGGGGGNVSSPSNSPNYIPIWTSANTLSDSSIAVAGGTIMTADKLMVGTNAFAQAQLHVSGSTIISGSSEITLDYDRLPKSNPDIKGRVWIHEVSGLFMVSSGIAPDVPTIIIIQPMRMVSAGPGHHSLFLTTAGDVYACGFNSNGQLGDGTTVQKLEPTYITGDVTGISAGNFYSMFLSTSSESYACGRNFWGQLGDGTTADKWNPTHITGDVTGISAGLDHSMFLSTSSEPYACGLNNYGQLGDGTTVNKHVPTYITGEVRGVAAGGYHSMFLSTSSESYACGLNSQGQLGNGTTNEKLSPTHITGDVTGISAGTSHSVFLSTSSESYTCGQNFYGQLGDGTTNEKLSPTHITGDVTGVSAGHRHSMFLSTSSESYACGDNPDGQLGDGTTVSKDVPTYITGDASGISAGGYHSMFFSTSSEFYACGANTFGQLGDGTTVSKDVPTYISGQGA